MNERMKYQKKVVYQECTQAIIFARVSSKRQKDEGISLQVQEENTTQYCKDKGLKVIATYSIDESSTHGDRKVFHEMINFAAGCEGTRLQKYRPCRQFEVTYIKQETEE